MRHQFHWLPQLPCLQVQGQQDLWHLSVRGLQKVCGILFDEAHKARHRDEQFPKDLHMAYEAGVRMAQSLSQEQ
ncbi:hypothetical protein B5F76_08675 [Desulfovibrio sp. An276]|nr:hypothetical protein B5F76_08675 [Desulfovibrio sp. An276]